MYEPGHIRPNCPLKVKRIASPPLTSTPNANYISALLNGVVCNKCVVDSGSDVTCVSKHLVDSSSYTGKATVLKSYKSSDASIRSPLAIVRLQVADFDKTVEVAVCDDMTDDILLGQCCLQ